MIRPNEAKVYDPIDLKLGIKSSLPSVKQTLALLFLMFESESKPATIAYSVSQDDKIILNEDIEHRLFEKLRSFTDTVSETDFHQVIINNLMLKSQLEALLVAFELVWKVAKIRFTDGRLNGAERTGGARFPKTVWFTTNLDLLDEIIQNDEAVYLKTLYNWLGIPVEKDDTAEKSIIQFLTIISEGAIYKLVDGENDVIFNSESLYATILSNTEPVDIAGDKEAKGSLRILKSAFSEELFTALHYGENAVSATDVAFLQKYSERVATFHQLNASLDMPQQNENAETENIVDPAEQKALFKAWMQTQRKANGEPYSENTINSYIGQMERGYNEFDKYHDFTSVFQIQDVASLAEYTEYLFSAEGFDEFNDRAGNKACSCGLAKYSEYLTEMAGFEDVNYETGYTSDFSRNRILFGAPGTGKSYQLEEDRKVLLTNGGEYERVTFHPDYSYANFVGTYKPVPQGAAITYKYVPGPFMRVYVKALKNSRTDDIKPFLLLVEEINRANVAAVFGDVFQLLDRGDNEVSDYPIQASEDIKKYLAEELGGSVEDYATIRIPDNMFIWATMNSADQGVFPMDTAFKRRWDFTYLGIDANDAGISGKTVTLGTGANERVVEWNALRKAINKKLSDCKINEDKLLGPYFLSQKVVPIDGDIDSVKFIETFKSKIIMYLFDDAAKQKRATLFAENIDTSKYSSICDAFDEKGVAIFCTDISNKFPAQTPAEGDAQ